ncbi:hypothetical protein RZN22_14605 [Bacillaceae bacterium S4-13-58]
MRILVILISFLLLLGCSDPEVIRVGSPINDGSGEKIEFYKVVENTTKINDIRQIFDSVEETSIPHSLSSDPDVFFTLDIPEKHVSEIQAYLWFLEDESAIAKRGQKYYSVSKEHSELLKYIFKKE